MGPLFTRLDKWLAKHRSRFQKNLQPGASAAELAALAKGLGQAVPKDLAELLSWHNGQGDDYVGYFKDHWLLMSALKIADAKGDLDANALDHGWNKHWVPFLDDDGGNFVVLDLAQKDPQVVAFWMGERSEPLAPSLNAWLTDFVTSVEAGKYHEDPERGTFTKKTP